MNVKRYEADTIQEALTKVKVDLGPDATILFVREIKHMVPFRLSPVKRVEVVAGVQPRQEGVLSSAKLEMIQYELRQMKDFMKGIALSQAPGSPSGAALVPAGLREIYKRLIACEVEETIAGNLIEGLKQRLTEKDMADQSLVEEQLVKQIAQTIDVSGPIGSGGPKIVAFVGPTGVGKTTTIAKLAANYTLMEKKSVGLITIDTYRIAAVEQLKTYAEIMGIAIDVVFTPKELVPALQKQRQKDLILIDTAGRNPLNELQMDELKNFIGQDGSIEVQLLMSLTTKHNEMNTILKRFELAKVNRLILTKLDEVSSFGNILSAAVMARKPISYVTTGQDVPEDIELADSMKLARLVLNKDTNPFIRKGHLKKA